MDMIKLKPEREQKTLWTIRWLVFFIAGIILYAALSVTVKPLIFGITAFVWTVIMVLIGFWIPAAFRALEYYIDDEGVKMKGGVVWKKHVTVPYPKITNVDITRGPLQRHYNIGTIHVQTAGAAGSQGEKAELRMHGIRELDRVRNAIIVRVRNSSYRPGVMGEPEGKILPVENVSILKDILKELKEIKNVIKK